MRIELFGIARVRAGREAVEVDAADLGEAILALAATCPALEPEVVKDGRLTGGFLASLNGELFVTDAATPLAPTDSLLVLSSQAGG
ncbi:MAG: ubiquitin family protein [Planctomycetota bacterium]